MIRKSVNAICVMAAIVFGLLLGQQYTRRSQAVRAPRVLYYVDPMHPNYKSDRPGIAPDCGMPLEPVYAEQKAQPLGLSPSPPTPPGTVRISSEKQRLLGIHVARVKKVSGTRTLRIPGRITVDETRVYRVNVGVDGFVKTTQDDAVGNHVQKDQRLAIIYSPEFLSVTGGYLSASERTQANSGKDSVAGTQGLVGVQNWADRLRNLGMSDRQIKELSVTRNIPDDIYVVSPADGFILSRNISPGQRFERRTEFYRIADLSHVWILADLFTGEARYLLPGRMARISLPDQPGSLAARISGVLPQIDPSSRTLKLRLEAGNQNYALRPDMFVNVDLPLPLPAGLSVPVDAVLDSGLGKHVFVDRGNGLFEAREVETGERFGDRVEVVRGVAENEQVVVSGTFLVDSESRLKTSAWAVRERGKNRNALNGSEVSGSSIVPSDDSNPTRQMVQKTTTAAVPANR